METKAMKFSNRIKNSHCGPRAALIFSVLSLAVLLPLSTSAQQSSAAPGSRKVIIDNSGHMPQLEQADRTIGLITTTSFVAGS